MTRAVLAAALVASGLGVATAQAAHAGDAPPAAVAEFNAPLCEGTTQDDPTDVDPRLHAGYDDLTLVAGARLDSYNKGNVVPLYDSYGWAEGSYPPLCGTYYDPETGGPQSVWMFCTDVRKDTCGDIGPGGTLTNHGDDVGDLEDRDGNPRLDADQERVIAWLIQNGYDYEPSFGSDGNATRADQSTSDNRYALQNLIWCVSDADLPNAGFQAMCAKNLPEHEQQEILAKVPGTAEVELALDSPGQQVVVGEERVIRLTTNVFNQPIELTATGTAAGTLRVCNGPGDLSDDVLTVTGVDPTRSETVELCLTPTANGSYGLEASAEAVQADRLQWARADDPCQVYARFRHDAAVPVSDEVEFLIEALQTQGQPKLVTKASHQVVEPGAKLFDEVTLTGFEAGHGAKGVATLYGPFTKVNKKVCKPANRVATVRFTPRNGTVRTPKVKVAEPGYYTWVARTTEDSHNRAASHRCGLAEETTLVRKSTYTVTKVDGGYAGKSVLAAARGGAEALKVGGARIDATISPVGHRNGKMLIPGDVHKVGRLKASAAIGDKIGTTVLGGHVSDRSDRPGALWNLKQVRKGQVLAYHAGGKVHRYKVTKVQKVSRDKKLPKRFFRTTGAHRLVVITCTDKVVSNGRFHYTKNLVVTAKPIK